MNPLCASSTCKLVLVSAFFLALITPLIVGISSRPQEVSTTENRALNPSPERPNALNDLVDFPRKFDLYFKDRVGLRPEFLRINNAIRYHLDFPPVAPVLIGKSGWLFHRGRMEVYRNTKVMTPEQLSLFTDIATFKQAQARKFGARYYFLLTAQKSTIYPEYYPSTVRRAQETSLADQVMQAFQSTGIPCIDLRTVLMEAKTHHSAFLYFKTDTHWNDVGANVAQVAVIERLHKDFSDLMPVAIPNTRLSWLKRTGNLAEMLNNGEYRDELTPHLDIPQHFLIPDNNTDLTRTIRTVNDQGVRHLLVGGNSQLNWLAPFLSNYMKTATYAHHDTLNSVYRFNTAIKAQPVDIYLDMWEELSLFNFLGFFEESALDRRSPIDRSKPLKHDE